MDDTFNIYSPDEEPDEEELDVTKRTRFTLDLIKLSGGLTSNKFNYLEKEGEFNYIPRGKKQRYMMRIVNYHDAVIFAGLLTRPELIKNDPRAPDEIKRVANLFIDAAHNSDKFNMRFYDQFEPWLNMRQKVTVINGVKRVVSPITGRNIRVYKSIWNKRKLGDVYKQIFGTIPLRNVVYDKLQLYKTEDYKIDGYCVPSYLQHVLTKKEFKKIESEFIEKPTPTYIELTTILNKISYGLTVFITDTECIQTQEEYKKNINIMIHDTHLYAPKSVRNNKISCLLDNENIKDKLINNDDFEDMSCEVYTNSCKLVNGIKYKCDNRYKEVSKHFDFLTSFSKVNIDFFNECEIRPIRYITIDKNISAIGGFDINACYPNILNNKSYVFPRTTGHEKTQIFSGTIKLHGFYYIEIKEMTDIDKCLFHVSKFWVLGYLIDKMKLKKRCKILYEHVARQYTHTTSYTFDKFDKTLMTLFSGYLGKYTTEKIKSFQCMGIEQEAYMKKYEDDEPYISGGIINVKDKILKNIDDDDDNSYITKGVIKIKDSENDIKINLRYRTKDERDNILKDINDKYNSEIVEIKDIKNTLHYRTKDERDEILKNVNDIVYHRKPAVNIRQEKLKKKSGLYVYLAILQYARYELWQIYNEVKNYYKDVKVKKIYTDSIVFNVDVKTIDLIKLNDKLKKNGFTVKHELSPYTWNHTNFIAKEPVIIPNRDIIDYDNNNDVMKLLEDNQSFFINAKAGYGKSHTIQTVIMEYLNKMNKKYIMTSTTVESCKLYKECVTLQSLLSSKDTCRRNLLKTFEDIEYLIIDECSFLNIDLVNNIQHLKCYYPNLKIITAGDVNQCTYGENIMITDIFYDLVDYNSYNMQWHDKARYDKDYDNFLTKLLVFKNGSECVNHIKTYFKDQVKNINDKDKDNNNIKIVYTHAFGEKLKDKNYITTHSVQGKTISEKHSVYQINQMPINVLYTALSRTSNQKNIDIYF